MRLLCLLTWWKGSSLYSFLAGGQTGVPPPSPSVKKRSHHYLSSAGKSETHLSKLLSLNTFGSTVSSFCAHLSQKCRMICTRHSAGSLPTSGPLSRTRAECSRSRGSSGWNIWSCSWCRTWRRPDRNVALYVLWNNPPPKLIYLLWHIMTFRVCFYLHSVVFLVVVRTLAVSECAVTGQSFNSPAEGAVRRFRILLTGRLIWRWLLIDTKHMWGVKVINHPSPLMSTGWRITLLPLGSISPVPQGVWLCVGLMWAFQHTLSALFSESHRCSWSWSPSSLLRLVTRPSSDT